MPDLLARQIDAMVKETAKVVSKEGAANANHYEVEVFNAGLRDRAPHDQTRHTARGPQ
jgi:hypothetical protein